MQLPNPVHDPIHGPIHLDQLAIDLINTPEVQRLRGLRQLGATHLIFPSANHTRFEHSIGTMHLARELGKHLGMGEEELELVTAAGLLHDIGHGPFSHATEDIMVHKLGMTHEERTGAILTGKVKVLDELGLELGVETLTAREILESYGIDPRIVAGIATGTYLSLIHI